MKGRIACLAAWLLALAAPLANASPVGAPPSPTLDPLGDLITATLIGSLPGSADYYLKATLYHAGERGIRALDSLGCKVVPMRTAAVDGVALPRHTVLFIKETVGLPMPDGSKHDGYWYASDEGSAIHSGRFDVAADAAEPRDADGHEGRRVQRLPAAGVTAYGCCPASQAPCGLTG